MTIYLKPAKLITNAYDLKSTQFSLDGTTLQLGGNTSGGSLTLSSTSNATKGKIYLGADSAYDEANKRLGIGTTSPGTIIDALTVGAAGDIRNTSYYASGSGSKLTLRHARGTVAVPVTLSQNDVLGQINFAGHDGTNFSATRAQITVAASEEWDASGHGTFFQFKTTDSNSTTLTVRESITQNGILGIGSDWPVISDGIGVHIMGKILRLGTTKTPTGTGTGNVGEICWDTSYIYVCTATNDWRRAGLTDF